MYSTQTPTMFKQNLKWTFSRMVSQRNTHSL